MNNYTDLFLAELLTSIGYAFLGLAVGSIIVYVLYKVGYLKRDFFILKIITKLYFIFIPILFLVYFWIAGTVMEVKGMILKEIDEVTVELKKELYPTFANSINEQVKTFIKLDKIPSNQELIEQFLTEINANDKSSVYQISLSIMLEKILDVAIGDNIGREVRVKALTDLSSKKAFDYGFDKIQSEVNRQVAQFTGLFLAPMTIIFFISILLIKFEIIISNFYFNKIHDDESAESTIL